MEAKLDLKTINKIPLIVGSGYDPGWDRIFGATFNKKTNFWMFPAYAPFVGKVLEDLEIVCPTCVRSATLLNYCATLPSTEDTRIQVDNFSFPVKSFSHQLEGTTELLHNHRWVLRWEMGTGKTKIAIDAIQILKEPALILCPLIAIDNWEEEIALHSANKLTTIKIIGTPKQKLKKIAEAIASKIDVVIVSYDTVSTYGYPMIHKKAKAYLKQYNVALHEGLSKPLKRLNDAKKQLDLIQRWHIREIKPAQVREEIETLVAGKPQWLTDFKYDIIVADESHRIKNPSSARSKAALKMAKHCYRRVLLTGTMSLGDPVDLYPQLKFLAPFLIKKDLRYFKKEHYITAKNNEHIVVGYKNLSTLNKKVTDVSSKKALQECITLPDRRFIQKKFKLSSEQSKKYNEIVNTWKMDVESMNASLAMSNGAVRVSKLLQICSGFVYTPETMTVCDTCPHVNYCVVNQIMPGSSNCKRRNELPVNVKTFLFKENPKLKLLMELLKDILTNGKVIIWTVLTEELDLISEALTKQKIKYVRVDGSNTQHIRKWEKEFKEDKECVVYLAQISTGIAITLNSAQYTIYYSRDWSVEHRLQSLGRNYRIGQDNKVVVYDLCGKGTLEEHQLTALKNKQHTASLLTDRLDCIICSKYDECIKKDVVPWGEGCIWENAINKPLAKAVVVHEEEKDDYKIRRNRSV